MTNNDYEPAFLDDDVPNEELPTFISTTNAYELFGLREGETVTDAIARNKLAKPVSSDVDSTQQPIGQTRLT